MQRKASLRPSGVYLRPDKARVRRPTPLARTPPARSRGRSTMGNRRPPRTAAQEARRRSTRRISMTANSVDQVRAQTLARYTEQGPGHINCAQAMVDFTMGILGRDQGIITVARYLGGGVSGMGGTCGAITGTAVALGLRDHYTATSDPELVPSTQAALKELIRAFEQEFGACSLPRVDRSRYEYAGRHGGIPSERGPRSLPHLRRVDVRPPPPPARRARPRRGTGTRVRRPGMFPHELAGSRILHLRRHHRRHDLAGRGGRRT